MGAEEQVPSVSCDSQLGMLLCDWQFAADVIWMEEVRLTSLTQ
jgi:hypothetical protein